MDKKQRKMMEFWKANKEKQGRNTIGRKHDFKDRPLGEKTLKLQTLLGLLQTKEQQYREKNKTIKNTKKHLFTCWPTLFYFCKAVFVENSKNKKCLQQNTAFVYHR